MKQVVLRCADCGHELNRTIAMTEQDIKRNWARLCIGSGLVAGKCPNGCSSTFSDCNINTKMTEEDVQTEVKP